MFARVSTYDIPNAEGAAEAFEAALPAIREMQGVTDAYLLVDRNRGKVLTITLWESEEAVRASEEAANRARSEASAAAGGSIQNVETYEVAFHETFGR